MTDLSNGVLAYHLAALEKENIVLVERQKRVTRYYPVNTPKNELQIIKYIRHRPVREIISFLMVHEYCTFGELVRIMEKAPSTVSTHLKRLKEAGIVSVRYGETNLYSLSDVELVSGVVSKYKETFSDAIVDNYIEMIDGI
jgi:DNA-binding transcriptional ArsR family regulator